VRLNFSVIRFRSNEYDRFLIPHSGEDGPKEGRPVGGRAVKVSQVHLRKAAGSTGRCNTTWYKSFF
jgi:hypothetical protein